MTLDALAGLFLLAALATALVVANSARQRAGRNLADQRRALAATQAAIELLHADEPIDHRTAVAPLGPRMGDLQWTEVCVDVDGRRVPLVALVPQGASR